MKVLQLKKDDDFCIFIDKEDGTWFQIFGRDKAVFGPGKYVDQSLARREIKRLRRKGYRGKTRDVDP